MKRPHRLARANRLFRGPCCLEDDGKHCKIAVLIYQSTFCKTGILKSYLSEKLCTNYTFWVI